MPIRLKVRSLGAVACNNAARIGASNADYRRERTARLISVFIFMAFPAPAFAQVGHTCVAYCDGDPAPSRGGGGGGYVAPSYQAPSLAAQANALKNQAAAIANAGNPSRALPLLRQAERMDPTNLNIKENIRTVEANILQLKGIKAFKEKNFDEAIEYFKRELRLSPGRAVAYANIASSRSWRAYTAGNLEEALKFAREELRYRRNKMALGNVAHIEGNILARKGEFAGAIKKEREAIRYYDSGQRKAVLKEYEEKLAQQKRQADDNAKQAQRDKQRQEEQAHRQAEQQQIAKPSSAYEQATQAKIHGDLAKSGGDVNAKIQASIPFDDGSAPQPSGGVHFQKSASTPPPSLLPGVSDDRLKKALDSTPQGRALLDNLTATENDLQRTQAKLEMLRSTPNAAANPDYSKALIAQDQLLQKLTPLKKQAQEIVTKVVLDNPDAAAAPRPDIDHIAVPAPDTGGSKADNSN